MMDGLAGWLMAILVVVLAVTGLLVVLKGHQAEVEQRAMGGKLFYFVLPNGVRCVALNGVAMDCDFPELVAECRP